MKLKILTDETCQSLQLLNITLKCSAAVCEETGKASAVGIYRIVVSDYSAEYKYK